MLLVYTHKITPRLNYIFKQVCTRILGIPVSFTATIEEFIAHDNLKLSYSTQQLGNEFHIKSHPILFEQGLSDIDIHIHDWENTKCFFYNGDKSDIPFDIFAASFYLLSRYEEYLPHVKDEFGRFTAKDSIAFKHQFLQQPVVDIWAYKFKKALVLKFPDYQFKERNYNVKPIVDVPMAYYFKKKGLMRTIGGTLNDLFRFKADYSLGAMYVGTEEYEKSEKYIDAALKFAREKNRTNWELNCLQVLGGIYRSQNKIEKARKTVEHAAELMLQTTNTYGNGRIPASLVEI